MCITACGQSANLGDVFLTIQTSIGWTFHASFSLVSVSFDLLLRFPFVSMPFCPMAQRRVTKMPFFAVKTFMAWWQILPGSIQSNAPKIVKADLQLQAALLRIAWQWMAAVLILPLIVFLFAYVKEEPYPLLTTTLVIGLLSLVVYLRWILHFISIWSWHFHKIIV